MTRLLDRYLFKEILFPFLMGVLILTFLLLLHQLLMLTEWVVDKGVSILIVADLFFKLLPSFFLLTIPMATAFASILAFNRLSFDQELIALNASGIGFSRILRPVFFLSVAVALLTLLMGTLSSHWGNSSFKAIGIKMLKEQIGVGLDAGKFTEIFPGLMIYAEAMPDATRMDRVFIYDGRSPEHPHVIAAKQGLLINNGDSVGLKLLDGSLYTHHRLTDQNISFASYSLKVRLSMPSTPSKPEEKAEDQSGQAVALQRKYSLAYASFLFCFMGVPLGMLSGKAGRFGPFVGGIGLILLYYSLNTLGDYMFSPEGTSTGTAIWVPNIILTPITFFLLIRHGPSA